MTDTTRQGQFTNAYKHLTIITFNANGLFYDNKRQQLFQILGNKNKKHIQTMEKLKYGKKNGKVNFTGTQKQNLNPLEWPYYLKKE